MLRKYAELLPEAFMPMYMKKEQDGSVWCWTTFQPCRSSFVQTLCIRQKENLRMPLHSQMEIDIFHCRKKGIGHRTH